MGSFTMLGLRAVLFMFVFSIVLQQISGQIAEKAGCKVGSDTDKTADTGCDKDATGLTCSPKDAAVATAGSPGECLCKDAKVPWDAAKKKCAAPDSPAGPPPGPPTPAGPVTDGATTAKISTVSVGVMGMISMVKLLTAAHC